MDDQHAEHLESHDAAAEHGHAHDHDHQDEHDHDHAEPFVGIPGLPAHLTGAGYWRSLEQLANSPKMQETIAKEFPGYDADGMTDPADVNSSRRRFLKLMGASMALAGLTLNGCRRWPEEKLAPYTSNPRGRTPGVPEQYATAWEIAGVASPLLVTSYDGRPIKIEGNPSHPFSATIKDKVGASDAFAQASVLEMYDPERSQHVVRRTKSNSGGKSSAVTWDEFIAWAKPHFDGLRDNAASFAILGEALAGPTAIDLKQAVLAAFHGAKWYEYEPISCDAALEGSRMAFGRPFRSQLHLDVAKTIVLLEADLLGTHPAHLRYAADWADGRRSADNASATMNRVFIAECGFSITGTVADVRLPVDPSRLYPLARAIAFRIGTGGFTADETLSESEKRFVDSAASELKAAGKFGVIAAGAAAPPAAHALAHAINQQIGAVGTSVTLLEDPAGDRPSHVQSITELSNAINAGTVQTLLILGGNPVYDAPADLKFGASLNKVPQVIHLSLYEDETSLISDWHLPRAHYLEAWGDARAWDGTATVVQPLIEALYGGRSIIELLSLLLGNNVSGEVLVRQSWAKLIPADFDRSFRRVLEAGLLPTAAFKTAQPALAAPNYPPVEPSTASGLYLKFEPDARVYDGRFANNGWLHETPDPLSKLCWDNAAMISKRDADAAGVDSGDMIRITTPAGDSLEIVAYILPGQPVGVIGLPLGYGRTAGGHIGIGLGFNTYLLRTTARFHVLPGAKIAKTGATFDLAMTQDHHIIDEIGAKARDFRTGPKYESGGLIHEASFADYKLDHRIAKGQKRTLGLQLFDPPMQFTDAHQWGMAIDLNTCIGCNACAVACQAENNIPIVGKEQVMNHREMNWLRIDRYFRGAAEDPTIEVVYQPMMCQHCENAPCEQVCPVGATMHDSEGLNVMVYNRCVGTRYCSNNCPYKVRRFNYFDYHSKDPREAWGKPWPFMPDSQQETRVDKIHRMAYNPEVTVRMRGVMEKCTYCVQRIHNTTIAKRAKGEEFHDGDVITACQQACPTQAIIFGDLNDVNSRVSKLRNNDRSYPVLDADLNTRPRTRYMARLRNASDSVTEHGNESAEG